NVTSGLNELDANFGSTSHWTFFRNQMATNGTTGLNCKRWASHIQVCLNIIGSAASATSFSVTTTNNGFSSAPFPLIVFGYPQIGNNSYVGVAPPAGPYWPGSTLTLVKDWKGNFNPPGSNGLFTFTAPVTTNAVYTTMGTGILSNICDNDANGSGLNTL